MNLKKTKPFQTGMTVFANDNMIVDYYAHLIANVDDCLGHVDIRL
ncbi:hypothetical protein PMI41_02430 [Phyllobacterium sp. YR531]|nr:hypothetical protein PMI41_02430 [Phyllobacterium sp. YR531]